MKYLTFLTFLIVFIMCTSIRGQWKILNAGGNFRMIDFVNENVGWLAGNNTLLKTEDGGYVWQTVLINPDLDFWMIDFIDENIGWAISGLYGSEIIKTTDGGQNWSVQGEFHRPGPLFVVNDSVVYVIAREDTRDQPYKIYKTNDGGTNWLDISPNLAERVLQSILFFNSEVGLITGHYYDANTDTGKGFLLKTIDGGGTWDEKIISEFENICDMQFVDDSIIYFLGSEQLCTTKDTLQNWTILTPNYTNIGPYFALDNKFILASTDNNLIKSTNGGISWEEKQSLQFHGYIDDMCFPSINNGFIIIKRKMEGGFREDLFLWRSIDAGNSWWIEEFCVAEINDCEFIDQNNGIICCEQNAGVSFPAGDDDPGCPGLIMQTCDGGVSWSTSGENYRSLAAIEFLNKTDGYILSSDHLNCSILKTIDGGNSWAISYGGHGGYPIDDFLGKDIAFLEEKVIWAVGNGCWSEDTCGAYILCSSDSGESWNPIFKYANTDEFAYGLNSIHVIGTTVWIVGERGMILRYTKQDQWHIQNTITELPLTDVYFSDENHGWIAGGYQNSQDFQEILLNTINGGQTWYRLEYACSIINDMFFEDSLRGWAVGSDTSGHGIIIATVDGGNKWWYQINNLSGGLNAIHYTDGYIWAVGDNGLILKAENSCIDTTFSVELTHLGEVVQINHHLNKQYPNEFSLNQNYPNPFNPKTVICYSLPVTSHLDLSIYNILGQKVATLVNKKQPAGTYNVEWEASGFASGVYLYKLETGNGYSQAKKLVLLK